MTVEFNKITRQDVDLFLNYSNLFSSFWSNNDILMDCDVTDQDIENEPDLYCEFFDFGAIKRNTDIIVPANLSFNIVKGIYHDPQSFFEIKRKNIELSITNLNDLSISAELSNLGEKVYKISVDRNINMLEAMDQLEYYASILNHTLE